MGIFTSLSGFAAFIIFRTTMRSNLYEKKKNVKLKPKAFHPSPGRKSTKFGNYHWVSHFMQAK